MKLRCFNDIPRNCALNIALDEFFFTKEPFEEVFRFYRWTEKAYTIGYFQKISEIRGIEEWKNRGSIETATIKTTSCRFHTSRHPYIQTSCYPVIRRLTGGLAVLHDADLSYSLVVSENIWKHIYDQETTYRTIHKNIKKALEKIGIFSMYGEQQEQQKIGRLEDWKDRNDKGGKSFSCVQTLYKDDLILNGRKIVGSCQRRRGKKILVEGSIHLQLRDEQVKIFTQEFFNNLSQELHCDIVNKNLTEEEITAGKQLCAEKYNNDKWNKLF